MFPTVLSHLVTQVILSELNVLKLCLLLFLTVVIVASLFKWLKGTRGKKRPQLRLNCWFCNEDVADQPEKADSWRCPYCDQYNGFTEDGDYNQPLTDQFEVKEFKTPTVCSQSEFITGTSVLCESCTQNQVLKLRQIAAFVPFNEASYDDEVAVYRSYLEHRYSLCDKCRKQVSNYLTDQDKKLVSKMTDDQLSLLDRLKEKIKTASRDHQTRDTPPHQPVLPRLMFILCVCAGICHVIFSLALYSVSLASGAPSDVPSVSRAVRLYFSVLPDWLAVWGEVISTYCGCAFCFGGLLAAGKNSLYPVDAVHLTLWLMLTLLTSATPTAVASWFHVPRGRILMAGSNLLVSLVCCLRSRRPRHFMSPTVHKKQMSQPHAAEKGSRNSVTCDSGKEDYREPALPPSALPSPLCANSDGISQVEHVQQNMESLTLGLTKRSASSSSVWSLPAVVAASSVSPDSTTDRMTPSRVQSSPNILSPSKLTYLSLDSDMTAVGQCNVSRSPSPWMQINEGLQTKGSNNRNHKNHVIKRNHADDAEAHLVSSFRSHRLGPSEASRLTAGTTDRLQTSSNAYRSAGRSSLSSVLPDVGPCDSQTPESKHLQLSTSMKGNDKYHSDNVARKDSNLQARLHRQNRTSVGRGLNNNMFNSPEPVVGKLHDITPRRSQRIAMKGKLPKPWPLKKSWSCNIVSDIGPVGRSDFWQARDFLVSGQVWGRQFSHNSVNSTLASDLLPVQELRVDSHVCQAAVANNKDERLKCDNFLVKRNPYRRDISHQVMDSSDDDYDESDGLKQVTFRNKFPDKKLRRNDLSWTWLLIGVLMGASLTTNVFLVCQRWWAQAQPL